MKLLLENWRQYLAEGMKTPVDLPNNIYVGIKKELDNIFFYYAGETGEEIDPYADINGMLSIEQTKSSSISGRTGVGECDGAWIVDASEITKGWGPLLYDVAIEWATINGNGLTSDRYEVSAAARVVWDYYLNNRSDVKSSQLDDMQNTLTEPEKDNCNQYSASREAGEVSGLATLQALLGGEEEAPPESKWKDSPLSKRYTKEPTTIKQLEKINKLRDMTKGAAL